MSSKIARRSLQILRLQMRSHASRSPVEDSAVRSRAASNSGGEVDLRQLCEWCGSEMPEGSRVDRKYCGPKCCRASQTALETAARLEAKAGRICAWCDGPIAPTKRGHAKYCSRVCVGRAQHERRKRRGGTCAHCGAAFVTHKADQVYCSHRCCTLAMWARRRVRCPI